jgi:hypothetical protein
MDPEYGRLNFLNWGKSHMFPAYDAEMEKKNDGK